MSRHIVDKPEGKTRQARASRYLSADRAQFLHPNSRELQKRPRTRSAVNARPAYLKRDGAREA